MKATQLDRVCMFIHHGCVCLGGWKPNPQYVCVVFMLCMCPPANRCEGWLRAQRYVAQSTGSKLRLVETTSSMESAHTCTRWQRRHTLYTTNFELDQNSRFFFFFLFDFYLHCKQVLVFFTAVLWGVHRFDLGTWWRFSDSEIAEQVELFTLEGEIDWFFAKFANSFEQLTVFN